MHVEVGECTTPCDRKIELRDRKIELRTVAYQLPSDDEVAYSAAQPAVLLPTMHTW